MGAMLSLTIETPERLEDQLVALLWANGGLGSWSEPLAEGRVRIHGFVPGFRSPEGEELRLAKALRIDQEVIVSHLEAVAECDWNATWRRENGPIEVGRRFLVDPREPSEVDRPFEARGRVVLRLPARTAFGMGSHASTRLAIELLESIELAGRTVLDVGTGSGILAFAALALGARSAVALDLDPAAAMLLPAYADLNRAELNGRRPRTLLGTVAALADSARFDVALVNVVLSEIEGELARLALLVTPGGTALFSGILAAEAERAVAALARHGFVERTRRVDEEWIALVTRTKVSERGS